MFDINYTLIASECKNLGRSKIEVETIGSPSTQMFLLFLHNAYCVPELIVETTSKLIHHMFSKICNTTETASK
jgi:hypothetical protein